MDFVVTDLTAFRDGRVCIAGIDEETGNCIRPEPYLTREQCLELDIRPRRILRGQMTRFPDTKPPHVEDRRCPSPTPVGWKTSERFQEILAGTARDSVCAGFGCEVPVGQKYFPKEDPPGHSIITFRPSSVQLVMDNYGKLRTHVVETSGREFPFLPVADLLLREYVFGQEDHSAACRQVSVHVQRQDAVFCRIGIGRPKRLDDGRDGYWLQLNGLYSFPASWQEGVAAED